MSDRLVNFARQLRKDAPDVENILWHYLRGRQCDGFKFRRQHPIGNFIVDFVCIKKKLIIELDGSQHAESIEKDQARDVWLNSRGYRVLRF